MSLKESPSLSSFKYSTDLLLLFFRYLVKTTPKISEIYTRVSVVRD